MIRRRAMLAGSAGLLAAPAIVETANAQSKFDWKQCKGQKIEVNYQLSARGDLVKAVREKQKANPEQAVVISADKDVRYEAVLEVMDTLQQSQVKKVGLLAKPRGG